MNNHILAIDIGTTSVKSSIFDCNFTPMGFQLEEYELLKPGDGIVEMDPETYWEITKRMIIKTIAVSGVDPISIIAIAVTTQGETILPVDCEGRVLRNAIVWLDSRSEAEAELIKQTFTAQQIYSMTGIPQIDATCPICKIMWMKANEADIYRKTFKFLLLEDYIIMKLTGNYVTEKSLMSSTGYFDVSKGVLWDDMMTYAKVEKDKIPEILDCGVCVGPVRRDIADELGLCLSTMVATAAMDQVAAALGTGNTEPGIITETTGTALVVAATAYINNFDSNAGLTVYRHAMPGKYLVLAYSSTAGIVLKWFKDQFCQEEIIASKKSGLTEYAYLARIAQKVKPLSNGLVVFPYFSGIIMPEHRPEARGIFLGLSLNTKKSHFIRAIFESIAYMLRDNLEIIKRFGIEVCEIRSTGGGAKSDLWSEIKANVCNVKVLSMMQEESALLGAAILAGKAAGIYIDIENIGLKFQVRDEQRPNNEIVRTYNIGYEKYRKACEFSKLLE